MNIQEKIPLADYTSWLVGGSADFFCLPTTEAELREALLWARDRGQTVTLLGGGSNVLISDGGVRGLVIGLRRFSGYQVKEERQRLQIEALAGTAKSELLKTFLKYKLAPALFLAGLPGDTAGGVVMNAGVGEMITPREFVEITDWIEVLRWQGDTLQTLRLRKEDLHWEYRHSQGWQPGVITKVGISWPLEPQADLLEKVKNANRVRLSRQPLDMPSCGSVFVNPPGHKSAQLIESCGLKGYTIGGAQVSLKHANFIVNIGGAKATEIWSVIQHVKKTVQEQTGVVLSTEVIRLGDWPA
jgi:UDP-N-acetylmuramate dehydrogenase